MNVIIFTLREYANMGWEKIISSFVSSVACHWYNTNAEFYIWGLDKNVSKTWLHFLNATLLAGKLLTLGTTDQKEIILKNNPFKPSNNRRMYF